jgi:hypothetical protein
VTETVISTSDPTPPDALTSFALTGSAPRLGNASFAFSTGNDSHVRTVQLYRVASGAAFDPDTATLVGTRAVGPSASYTFTDGDASRSSFVTNGTFAADASGWTLGTGWAWLSGAVKKTAGTASNLTQVYGSLGPDVIRYGFDVIGRTAGAITLGMIGSPNVNGSARTSNGSFRERLTANGTNTGYRFLADASFDGSIDNVYAYPETASCAPQGVWDYYAIPRNGSDVAGPTSGPVTATII